MLSPASPACCFPMVTAAAVLQVEFPDPRTFFLTGTKGFFGGLLPSLACPNQWSNNNTSPVTSIDLPFTVGCNVKGACAGAGAVLQQRCWKSCSCTRCAPHSVLPVHHAARVHEAYTLLCHASCLHWGPCGSQSQHQACTPCFFPLLSCRHMQACLFGALPVC